MKGTHAILQDQCPVCYCMFLVGELIIMRVVERGVNIETDSPCGVMVEYLHECCAPPSERESTWVDDERGV